MTLKRKSLILTYIFKWRWVMNTIFAMVLSVFMASHASTEPPKFSNEEEISCLATNIYWEARNQSTRGQIAVGNVVMNRVKSLHFPDSVCEVVLQGPTRESWKTRKNPDLEDMHRKYYPVKNRCQFSWFCDGKSDEVPLIDKNVYALIEIMAFKIYHGQMDDLTDGAEFYHADYVTPEWRHTKHKTVQIQNHIFYRWSK